MKAKQDKHIDLNQFPHKNGKICWKDSVGIVVEFFYNGERHEIKILERICKDYFKIRVDDVVIDKAHISKITGLTFSNMFYKPDYFYDVGDVVNDLLILKKCTVQRKTSKGNGIVNVKAYNIKCLKDEYEFIISESDLIDGHGCPVCASRIIVKGINDVATTNPDLTKFFVNEEDAYTHSRCSDADVIVQCPYCGLKKHMRIAELSRRGYVTCDRCSDGVSYPNKFARKLFDQLNNQYSEYEPEYSPDWAGLYRYDNYIRLLDGRKIIVEMDGGYHYIKYDNVICVNDNKKDELCAKYGIKMIRIDCNYVKMHERYDYVKNNVIQELSNYFDLSDVDWDKCNEAGLSNYLFDVVKYYEDNPKLGLEDVAKHFSISMGTMYSYLYMGEELGLCTYVRADSNRTKNSKPVAMYDVNNDLIGIFKSAKAIEEEFPEKDFRHRSIRKCIHEKKRYKGYMFKFATYEEYQNFDYKK